MQARWRKTSTHSPEKAAISGSLKNKIIEEPRAHEEKSEHTGVQAGKEGSRRQVIHWCYSTVPKSSSGFFYQPVSNLNKHSPYPNRISFFPQQNVHAQSSRVLKTHKIWYYNKTKGLKHDMSNWEKKSMGTHNLKKADFSNHQTVALWCITNFHVYL